MNCRNSDRLSKLRQAVATFETAKNSEAQRTPSENRRLRLDNDLKNKFSVSMSEFSTAVLDTISQTAANNWEKGNKFERFIKSWLLQSPEYRNQLSEVWLWNEWPGRTGPDTGIDLVAREKNGDGLWAIQCKFFHPNHVLQRSDIDSFFTASGKRRYTHRLIVSTTDRWSKHAEDALTDQQIPCSRLGLHDLKKLVHNWEAALAEPEKLKIKTKTKELYLHQREAVKAVQAGLKKAERGKLIMACGTGKTFTSLRIAEEQVKSGGLILFVVPSLSLLSQAMREWMYEKKDGLQQKYLAVCSDTKVGKDEEDIRLVDLPWPATTDAKTLAEQIQTLRKNYDNVIIFSTYQSLGVIAKAQKALQKAKGHQPKQSIFDLVICDEAHRTTGIESADGKISQFSQIHKNDFIQARKRLYMTATPRLYTDASKDKAKERSIGIYSMDDSKIYGEEFYRLDFSQAVTKDLLSDYKVIILSVSEKYIAGPLQQLVSRESEIKIPDIAKIIGCWNGLRYPEGKEKNKAPLRRAVAFTNRIKDSKIIAEEFNKIIQTVLEKSPLPKGEHNLNCEVKHVDGTMNALQRNRELDWLRGERDERDEHGEPENQKGEPNCHILSNARCLSEGIDVPALDAVMFLQPKASQVDIVQAVGRVMRQADGKDYGYIILPIAVPADIAPDQALDDNKRYAAIWGVLQALRAHDNRFNAIINQLELNQNKPDKIKLMHIGERGELLSPKEAEGTALSQLDFDFHDWHNAIYAKIVDRCGDRRYWESWAQDVARIAQTITAGIEGLLTRKNSPFHQVFTDFLSSLQKNIHPAIDREEAIGLLSQHTITRPIFDALFEDYVFSRHNPVSISMEKVLSYMESSGLKKETKKLQGFYDSVRDRARGIDNFAGKQKVMTELYEKFFATAFPKVAEKLGIVYTPIEVVDFILRSTDQVLQKEFQQGLSDKNVHILDPFSGTGSFLARLLQNRELLRDSDLSRKFHKELHANEIMLLAYYIAAINIEEAFHQRRGADSNYMPFDGIVFGDTFQMSEDSGKEQRLDRLFPTNSQRVEAQKRSPIRVIVGNPPWSAGQRSENDANKNLKYNDLDKRIEETYVKHSAVTYKAKLYDSYIRAIRWASDRIGREGVIAYVTNGSFIDGNASDGLRKCLLEEFEQIYCFNLRGNQRTSGEISQREGGKIFGQGSRAPVAITLLVKKGQKRRAGEQGKILYHDIGDYISREDKLKKIENHSLSNLPWQKIVPNALQDWINQRDPTFKSWLPMGTDEAKRAALDALKGRKASSPQLFSNNDPTLEDEKRAFTGNKSLFGIYSLGVATNRDTWVYNFSQAALQANMKRMIAFYNQQVMEYQKAVRKNPKRKVEDFINNDPTKIAWDREIKNDLGQEKQGKFSPKKIRQAAYRPFCKQWLYFDRQFNSMIYRNPLIFPQPESQNLLICVNGKGAKQPSVLMVDILPDIQFAANGQCFPLYLYDEKGRRHDNISDTAQILFQEHYKNRKISKEDIFYYAYAILHWPAYKQRFAADLVKMLPRIPFVADRNFATFVAAGRQLGKLHTGYEQVKKYPLQVSSKKGATEAIKIEKMTFAKNPELKNESNKQGWDKSTIICNSLLRLSAIPQEAYNYVVNGKPAIEWVMERYQMKTDRESAISNDPNNWSEGGKYVIDLLKRVITVSMESVKVIRELEKIKE